MLSSPGGELWSIHACSSRISGTIMFPKKCHSLWNSPVITSAYQERWARVASCVIVIAPLCQVGLDSSEGGPPYWTARAQNGARIPWEVSLVNRPQGDAVD